jgi:hypothetical protein
MCSRHQEPGATSEYVRTPFLCLVEDYDGARAQITVKAMGRNDARNQAIEAARDLGYEVAAVLEVRAA